MGSITPGGRSDTGGPSFSTTQYQTNSMRGSNPIAFNLNTDEQPTPGMAAQDLYSEMLKKVLEPVQANLDKLASEAKRTNDRHEETMKIMRDNFIPTATRRRGRTENTDPGRQESREENNRRREPRNGGNEERDEARNDRNRRENGNRSDEESPGNQENGKEKSDERSPETPRNEQNQDDARSGLNSKREERREEKEDAPPKTKRQDKDAGKESRRKDCQSTQETEVRRAGYRRSQVEGIAPFT
ncbi:DNA polymerase II subunit B4-like [Mercurialis annua]|uniref:DNA polymerase II subunit B4-like n=1 Tax=Mercurialis annua TaxID=3986 RepID=UPI00215E2345|nr:DNA polymerase II subunit B4-like [Mercurialis annua]